MVEIESEAGAACRGSGDSSVAEVSTERGQVVEDVPLLIGKFGFQNIVMSSPSVYV